MNAWVDVMNELMGGAHMVLDFTLSDLRMLIPDAKVLCITAAGAVFCILAACQEIWFNHSQDHVSKKDKENRKPKHRA